MFVCSAIIADAPKEFYEKHCALVLQEGTLQKKRNAIETKLKNPALNAEERAALETERENLQQLIQTVRGNEKPMIEAQAVHQRRQAELLQKIQELQTQRRKISEQRRELVEDREGQERFTMQEKCISDELEKLREEYRRLRDEEAAQEERNKNEIQSGINFENLFLSLNLPETNGNNQTPGMIFRDKGR
jgi:chromosome segregation ATPase